MEQITEVLPKFRHLINKIEEIKLGEIEQGAIEYSSLDARMVAWEHVIVLLNSNFDVLKEMLLSPVISDIQTEIIEDFA